MLKILGLSKSYNDISALSNVDMHVAPGSIYGLVGTNGAGKTTLMKIAAGIYRASSGEVHLYGNSLPETPEAKAQLQFMADTPCFPNQQSIKDASRIYRGMYPKWNQERFLKLTEGLGLDINKPAARLSKGQQRLGTFALCLSTMPNLMLLDEPLDGLDPVMRHQVKNLLVQDVAERGMSILISSHNLRELEDLCDTIGLLHQGTLLMQRELDSMKCNVHKVQLGFAGAVPENWPLDIEILFSEPRGSIHLLVVKGDRNYVLDRFRMLNPTIMDVLPLTLEEIFIYEMGDRGYAFENILL